MYRPSLWKDIEQSFISDATLECVLCSNLSLHKRILQQMIPFRFMQLSVQTVRKILPYNANETECFG